MIELFGISFSAYTERARWALDVSKVKYAYRAYTPMLGEPAMRSRIKVWMGKITMPILIDGKTILRDSVEIARFADAQHAEGIQEGGTLFPHRHRVRMEEWIGLSNAGLASGRALALHRALADNDALLDTVPKSARKLLGPLALPVGKFATKNLLRKYGVEDAPQHELESELAAVLRALRDELRSRGREIEDATIFEEFSFADITLAQVLAFVSPPPFGLRISKDSRRVFRHEALAQEFDDLVRWRDALYAKHRPR